MLQGPTRKPVLRFLPAFFVLVAGGAWLLARERYFSAWTDDDAFISFRYARNLAEGHGLVFNPGERVEGYTNFLWTVLLAAFHQLGADLPHAARFLGGLFSLVTPGVLLLFGCTSILQSPRGVPAMCQAMLAVLGPLLLCLSDAWAAWAVGGLENVMSAFFVSAAFLAYVLDLEGRMVPVTAPAMQARTKVTATVPAGAKGRRSRAPLQTCALALALAVVTHPANLLFAVPIALHALLRIRAGLLEPQALRAPVALFLLLVGAWMIWRLVYYGDLLPNTFYAKVGFSRFVIWRGLQYGLEVLQAFPVAAAALVVLALLLGRERDPLHPGWILVGAVALHLAYVVGVGGEQFPALRSCVVLLPLFALVLQMLANRLCGLAAVRSEPRRASAGVTRHSVIVRGLVAAGVVAGLVTAHAAFLHESPRLRVLDGALRLGRTALSRAAALRLEELLPPGTLFAHSGAGLIAYYTNFRWIDTLGLTDRHIARTPVEDMGKGAAGHEKGDGAYVWSRRPDYVMFPGYPISNRTPGTKSDRELFAIPEFHTTYRSVRLPFEFKGPADDVPRQHFLFLWERVDREQGR